jgi:hypothetical protein
LLHLLELGPAIDHVLLDVAHGQLNFEVVGVFLGDFVQPEKDRLQPRQILDPIDLLIQALEFVERIQVLCAHDAILHSCSTRRDDTRGSRDLHSKRACAARAATPLNRPST